MLLTFENKQTTICKYVCQLLHVYLNGTYYNEFTQLSYHRFQMCQTCFLLKKKGGGGGGGGE